MQTHTLDRNTSSVLSDLIISLPSIKEHHAPGTRFYHFLKTVACEEIAGLFDSTDGDAKDARRIEPFGDLIFPYYSMGAVDSLNLFDLDELIIFAFYWTNRNRYQNVLDIGANIGLHATVLSKAGFEVRAYEPDPKLFKVLQSNLQKNRCDNVTAVNAAVSSESQKAEFIRVLGNMTGSHIAGSKRDPWGDLERFPVTAEAIGPLIDWADLIKMDAEGHEKEILLATEKKQWTHTDALIEIENAENAQAVYAHFQMLGVSLFAQKINWNPVTRLEDMPTSYHEGTLFVSCQNEMPWTIIPTNNGKQGGKLKKSSK